MSPRDRESLRRKLQFLRKTLEKLQPYRQLDHGAFFADEVNCALVERYMQTAIESVIDSSRLLVALLGWRRVKEETDAFLILARHSIFSEALANRLVDAKGFRNVLVHHYAEVEPELVYRHLKDDCPDLDEFARAIERYLQEHEV